MKKLLVASHGSLADGIRSSLTILTGETKNVTFLNAYVNKEDIDETLNRFFSDLKDSDEAIIFTDLLGGSVNQKIVLRAQKKKAFIIAGFNLPIILEVLLTAEPITEKSLKQMIEKSRKSLLLVNQKPDAGKDHSDSEEEFLN